MTKLSEYFTLEELTFSQTAARKGIPNTPSREARENLRRLAEHMDAIRELLGHPVFVSSGYRSPELNAATGGSATSAHMLGLACDFTCPGFGTPLQVAKAIDNSDTPFDQLIHEYGRWVHLGLSVPGKSPRGQLLTATTAGYKPGLVSV